MPVGGGPPRLLRQSTPFMAWSISKGAGAGKPRGRWRPIGVLGWLAVLAAVGAAGPAWLRALWDARQALRDARHAPLEARIGEEMGPGFLDAVERVRASVPPDGSYVLDVDPYGRGSFAAIAFRKAVLPRKPILLRRYSELKGEPTVRPRTTVVVEDDSRPPAVLDWVGFHERFDPSVLGIRDDSLPASVDELHFDPDGTIRVRGWCQGRQGLACDVAAVLVNDRPAPLADLSRERRLDVEAALPWIGPCAGAGYRLSLPRGVATGEKVSVQVVFRTADGRWRAYPVQVGRRAR